jgi:hypothetical protein
LHDWQIVPTLLGGPAADLFPSQSTSGASIMNRFNHG